MSTSQHSRQHRSRLHLESLEQRTLLAGDIAAGLGAGGLLSVIGDDAPNGVLVHEVHRETPDATVVRGGETKVTLDAPLLAAVASLTISSVNGETVELPEDEMPTVPFPITATSDLRLTDNEAFPILGAIGHTGTVGFNGDAIIVGNFDIGYDATRVAGEASGFYVADTVAGLGVLFDIGSPVLEIGESTLTVASSDLLVSPEFAGILLELGLAESDLTGADVGDAAVHAETSELHPRGVEDGATSVVLNTELLASIGLNLTGAVPTAESALEGGVAFEIEDDSTFQLLISEAGDDLVSLGGLITHTGTVTFQTDVDDPATAITVGDFNIGFDATRASDSTSGFYVEDTVGGLGILFDIASPTGLSYDDPELSIGPVDLLVSPEFAGVLTEVLGAEDLTGADVGDAQIDAYVTNELPYVEVRGIGNRGRTDVNGGRAVVFPALSVDGLSAATAGGSDRVRIARIDLSGDLTVDLGGGWSNTAMLSGVEVGGNSELSSDYGRDWWWIKHSWLGDLSLDTGGGNDRVSLILADVEGDASVDLGLGRDVLSVLASDVGGQASFDGGPGRDRFFSLLSDYGSLEKNNFGWRWGWRWRW